MKVKKLLAGVLSAAMVLSTMSFNVLAAETTVSTSEEFKTAVFNSDADEIVLANDIEVASANNIYEPDVYTVGKECVIDLGGHTLDLTDIRAIWAKNSITVKNGKIIFSQVNDALFHLGTWEENASGASLNLVDLTFEQEGTPSNTYFIAFDAADSVLNIDNCEIKDIKSNYALITDNSGNTALTNIKNSVVKSDDRVFQNGTYVISGTSTVSGSTGGNVTAWTLGNDVTISGVSSNAATITVTSSNGIMKAFNDFADALAAATADDTIKIYEDITYSKHVSGANRVTNAKALDLNGKTLSLPDYDYNFGEITISNGTIESTKTDRAPGTALIFQCDDDSITFDGVTINTNDLSADGYVIGTMGGDCTFKNSTINVNPTTTTEFASLFSTGDHTSEAKLVIENSEINVSNASTKIALWGNVEIKGSSKINADLTNNDGIRLNNYGSLKITATTDTEGNDVAPEINITVSGNNRYGINIADETVYEVDSRAVVNTSVYRTPSASNIADDEIKLSFEDVTVNAGEKVYDLYVEAASNKTINRLTTADLTFALTNDTTNTTPISYEIFGTDKVTVQPDNADSNKYLFYFNGVTAPSGTGVKVKVGQVKFNGYGKFSFKATAGEAHATTIDGENVVTDFVAANQAEGQGKLNIDAELTDVEIAIPTKELTISVDFPNAVADNAKAYQDMKITVVGGTVDETYELGTDDVAMVDGKYVVKTELPENISYTVTVSGAGYRTARYTVTMTADKTLNFWNNVKDNATEVEEGNTAIKKNVTFLAGELVNDGKINIYDLSAVVSYFGTTNNVNAESQYAKYDLNRDGKIDSKDIAYVLVSWGN